jgi:hypothetical protein
VSGATRHLALGARVAAGRPGLVLLQGGVDALATITTLLPIALAVWLAADAFARALPLTLLTFEPRLLLDALLVRVTSPRFLYPVLGLALSGALLSGVLRVFFLSGALGVVSADLRDGTRPETAADSSGRFMDNALARFPAGLGVAGLAVLTGLLWAGWSIGLLAAGVILYAAGTDGSAGAALGGAGALALATTLFVASAFFYEVILRLTLVRALVLGEGPAVALYEAGRLVGRRLGTVLAVLVTVAVVQLFLVFAVAAATAPMALLPPEAAGSGFAVGARIVAWLLRVVALAWLALAAHTAFTALALDDAGLLPAPPPPEETPVVATAAPAPSGGVVTARPVEPARPVLTARPVAPGGMGDAGPEAPPENPDGGDPEG